MRLFDGKAKTAGIALAVVLFAASIAAGERAAAPAIFWPSPSSDPFSPADTSPEAADSAKVIAMFGRWEADQLRELSRRLRTLPESAASEALWLVATAPARIDTFSFFAAALSSPYPAIRRQAADILVSFDTPDAMRLVGNMLESETDPETVTHVVTGLSRHPPKKAVRLLMEVIQKPGAKPALVSAAADLLRKVTRATVPDNANAWRDWWLDNSHLYE